MEFLNLIEITVEVSVLVILISIVRGMFAKKLNPNIRYFLWIFVAIRVLIPFKMEFSIELPEAWEHTPLYTLAENAETVVNEETIPENPVMQNTPVIVLPVESEERHVTATVPADMDTDVSNVSEDTPISVPADDALQRTDTRMTKAQTLFIVWLCGALIMTLYIAINNIRLLLKLKAKRRKIGMLPNRIPLYAVSGYNCLMGILFPAVYVDVEHLSNKDVVNDVIRHELQHYKVRDNYWQFLRVVSLILQWHNPFMWWAYFASRKDCELACDARVVRDMSAEERHDYGNSLLAIIECGFQEKQSLDFNTSMGTDKKFLSERLHEIMENKYKKRIVLSSVLIGIIACICFISIHVYADAERSKAVQENADGGMPSELEESAKDDSTESSEDAENFFEEFSRNYPNYRFLDFVSGSEENAPIAFVAVVENIENGSSSTLFIVTDNGVEHWVTLASDQSAAYIREDRLVLRENVIQMSLSLMTPNSNNEIHDFELTVTQEKEQGEVVNTLFSSKETIRASNHNIQNIENTIVEPPFNHLISDMDEQYIYCCLGKAIWRIEKDSYEKSQIYTGKNRILGIAVYEGWIYFLEELQGSNASPYALSKIDSAGANYAMIERTNAALIDISQNILFARGYSIDDITEGLKTTDSVYELITDHDAIMEKSIASNRVSIIKNTESFSITDTLDNKQVILKQENTEFILYGVENNRYEVFVKGYNKHYAVLDLLDNETMQHKALVITLNGNSIDILSESEIHYVDLLDHWIVYIDVTDNSIHLQNMLEPLSNINIR